MVNVSRITRILHGLGILRFFPAETEARIQITRLVCSMISDEATKGEAQADWLVRVMTSGLFNEWPGPSELRAVFCSRFSCRDGISAYSVIYPDGIPSEYLRIPEDLKGDLKSLPRVKPPILLPPVDDSPVIDRHPVKPPSRQRQSELVKLADDAQNEVKPPGTYREITQADIDAELAKRHRA